MADRTKRTTRQSLVEAAVAVLRREGASAVTTQRLTEEVGIVQSGFYRHFANIDECLLAAGEEAGRKLRDAISEDRLRHGLAAGDDPVALTEHLGMMLQITREDWPFIEFAGRFRHERTDLGRALARAWRGVEDDIAKHLVEVARRKGVRLEPTRVKRLAAVTFAVILSVGEQERRSATRSRQNAAKHLAAMISSLIGAEFAAAASGVV